MAIDLRSVLDDQRISWRDRGKNVGRGEIVITCPWCDDDPSEHLSINEEKEKYYCRRCARGGTSMVSLLVKLGVNYWDAPALLNKYNTEVKPVVKKPTKPQSNVAKVWQRFQSADENYFCTEYLRNRGFLSPIATCRQYDLRFSPEGIWAQRLLLPITENGEIVSWVGRALHDALQPKYYLGPSDHPIVYLPRPVREILIVVEGPLDALKVAVATDQQQVSSIALLGKGFSPEKIMQVIELARSCRSIFVAMDADVSIVDTYTIVNELAAVASCPVDRLAIPYGEHDPGGMSLENIRGWIK